MLFCIRMLTDQELWYVCNGNYQIATFLQLHTNLTGYSKKGDQREM